MYRTWAILGCLSLALTGCKYYGGALPPETPVSMDESLRAANNAQRAGAAVTATGEVVKPQPRPAIRRPSYVPEKELAVVAPPRTLLVWTYPHITDNNTRVFGSWSTIFLQDRYEWVPPLNELPIAGNN